MPSASEREVFDRNLEKVIDSHPEEVLALLEETPVIVDDEPSREILAALPIEARRGESDLCGLHTGVPLSERSSFDDVLLPNVIHLFRGPIFRLAEYEEKRLEKQIRITLLHELGHLHGLTEEELDDLGYA
jgi:predicted Zn-dependent protease with MMP-like domain